MRPNARSLSSIDEHLRRVGGATAELALRFAAEALSDRLPQGEGLLDDYDEERASIYFHFYGLPVLEAAGLLRQDRCAEALLWARIQICLGMHLRYADDILDADVATERLALIYRRSRAYLAEAQRLLIEAGHSWGPTQEAVYVQFIEYEMEMAAGLSPHFDTQWRRVSPLCVVPKAYLDTSMSPGFTARFQRYLSWSLAHADCADLLIDLGRDRITPITRLAHEIAGTGRLGVPAASMAHQEAKAFLTRSCPRAGEAAPLWNALIAFLEMAYGVVSEAVDAQGDGPLHVS